MLDLTVEAGRTFAIERMQAALALGFDGWMADYAEWLPTDAVLANREDALRLHNDVPRQWQETNLAAQDGYDATFFARSGWIATQSLAPVVWAGDQRTSFDADDGLPTVVSLGLGLSASGVTVYAHDIAGYQSIGNDPSDKELWFRWAALGAFSPIMRTHHGAFEDENHQFDADFETLEFWGQVAREHTRLWPYRYGLAAQASRQGTPMLLPVGFVYQDSWDRTDAWLLGAGMLVAPVLERGVTGRQVELPDDTIWYDWWTQAPVSSGWFDAEIDEIPVFIASGTTIPTFAQVPDTLMESSNDDVVDLEDVDGERVIWLFGGGGPFIEADGTRYEPSGVPTGAGEQTETLTSGTITVAGVSLVIAGDIERRYRVVVVP
jgi:alpha-glucosidase